MKPKHKFKKNYRRYKPLYAVVIVQVLIILFFFQIWEASTPSMQVLKNAAIVVDDVKHANWIKGSCVIIFSANEEYAFPNLGYYTKYPNSKLAQAIKVGDKLYITYYTQNSLVGSSNWIVDAYSQTNKFRTIDEYTRSYEGLGIWVIIFFLLIESIYLAGSILYLRCCNLLKAKKNHRKRSTAVSSTGDSAKPPRHRGRLSK